MGYMTGKIALGNLFGKHFGADGVQHDSASPESITQKAVHTYLLTARERERWFL